MKQIDFREVTDDFWEIVAPLLEPLWQAMDGSLVQAPVCAQKSADEGLGRNPTDRGRSGSKIHLHVDGQGIPLGVTVVRANVHGSLLREATLKNSCEMGAWFLGGEERHLCLDKGMTTNECREKYREMVLKNTSRVVRKSKKCQRVRRPGTG